MNNETANRYAAQLRSLAAELERRDRYIPGIADAAELIAANLRDQANWTRAEIDSRKG